MASGGLTSALNKETVLVTGGAGFIGSNFIKRLYAAAPKARVVCLDALTYAGHRENLKDVTSKNFVFVKGDVADTALVARLVRKYKPAYVINFAAESHVDRSIHEGAGEFIRTNVMGTGTLLQSLVGAPSLKKYVQVSTDEVYGALPLKGKKAFVETSPLLPNSPYAASKAAADLVTRSFFVTYGIPAVTTRCSNNYGPYQHPEKLIPFSILRLLQRDAIAIYGDGKYVRDWIHVDDHCDALLLALVHGKPGEVYNIGANDEMPNIALARGIASFFKMGDEALTFVADRPGHDRRYAINSEKIRKELGWRPKHSLSRSLKDTIRWYVENEAWVKNALKRSGAANAHINRKQ